MTNVPMMTQCPYCQAQDGQMHHRQCPAGTMRGALLPTVKSWRGKPHLRLHYLTDRDGHHCWQIVGTTPGGHPFITTRAGTAAGAVYYASREF